MNIRLDPRTKLYMILVVSAVVMMSATTPLLWAVRIIITLVPIVLLIAEKRYASAFRFLRRNDMPAHFVSLRCIRSH